MSYFVAAVTTSPVEDTLETLFASVRYPLAVAISRSLGANDRADAQDALDSARQNLHLGGVYDAVENIWSRCLWLGWWIDHVNGETRAIPPDLELERLRAVGIFRYSSIASEGVLHTLEAWQSLPLKQRTTRYRRVVQVERLGKSKHLVVRDVELDEPTKETGFRIVAEEIYLQDTLDVPLLRLGGVTACQLLNAWSGIAPLAALTAQRFPSGKVETRGAVLNYAPVFDKETIEKAIAQSADVSTHTATEILSALTMKGTPREEAWFRPFIPVSADKLALIVGALAVPNLLRSIEEWLRVGGLDLGSRGSLFETYVRNSLAHSNMLTDAYVHPHALQTEVGDIDMCIQIGRTVITAELKCSLFPASSLEQHKYESTLSEAADQARRKASFVEVNTERILRQMGRSVSERGVKRYSR